MPIEHIKLTGTDHIPEEFTLETLSASLTEAEISALNEGDDPILPVAPSAAELEAAALAEQQAATEAANAAAAAQAQAQQKTDAVEIPDTTDAERVIAEADAKLEELQGKFDDGDLTHSEWVAQQRAIIQAQARAQIVIDRAQEVISQTVTQKRQTFYSTLDAFKANGNEFLWSQEHLNGWDLALKAVTGNQAYAGLDAARQIDLARDLYAANYKAINGKGLPGAKAKAADDGDGPGPRTDPRPEPVQTLAGFNTDSNASIEDGTFAAIDKMMGKDPIEAEKMLNRLTSDQRTAFLERV